MGVQLPSPEEWATRCGEDGEFQIASRGWTGGLRLVCGDAEIGIRVADGAVAGGLSGDEPGVVCYSGDEQTWGRVLEAVPGRFDNDLVANLAQDAGLSRSGDPIVQAQYYSAVMRAVELLRPPLPEQDLRPGDVGATPRIDAPVGRYVHLDLGGYDHRIYFEEAGEGIPILMQHTAGCHSSQWRHLFEMPQITDRFRLIAYDLPCHGKSVPPVQKEWWSQSYNLEGEFLRSVPLKLAEALELDRPIFMGCSVGGLLALDLAHKHPEAFRAVISVEGALRVGGKHEDAGMLWHPQIGNDYKARLMDGLMSPTSPMPYRKETSFVYASGWPPVFYGDLYYYIEDYDLTAKAGEIDTNRIGVHILTGEYDYSATLEMGREAHEAIAGSTFAEMRGVGHFPMSENPVAFAEYLEPILASIN